MSDSPIIYKNRMPRMYQNCGGVSYFYGYNRMSLLQMLSVEKLSWANVACQMTSRNLNIGYARN